MPRFFGTDGIRAIAGEYPLQPYTLKIVGMELTSILRLREGRDPKILLGGDTRQSTEWIAQALFGGISINKGEAQWAGVIPTPGIAFLTVQNNFDAGVVISASHNPYQDNGIKIFLSNGKKQDLELENAIEKAIKNVKTLSAEEFTEKSSLTKLYCDDTLSTQYLEFLCKQARDLDLSNLKLVVDCANGAASYYARLLFESLGAQVLAININPDGININHQCGSLYTDTLGRVVKETNADLGIAFDGDADRCLFTDHEGNLVDGDKLLFILASYLDEQQLLNPRCVIATVMSNLGLTISLRKQNIELIRCKVGDKYVLEELLRTGAQIGGEQSGHIIFPKIGLSGDGMLTALQILKVVQNKSTTLKELASVVQKSPQILINIPVTEKIPFENIPNLAKSFQKIERDLSEKGRILLRYSGTEKLARIMIEGDDENEIQKQAKALADIIQHEIGIK